MHVHRLHTAAPEIPCLGPFQLPGKTLQDDCQNIFNIIGNLLKTINCDMPNKEKVREIRKARGMPRLKDKQHCGNTMKVPL